jgi:organic hydroperoxide reductase OsmC/OhrA
MELREIQKPLKERYRQQPGTSKVTLHADGAQGDDAMSCSVDLGRLIQEAEAHTGVGGAGTAACSGDLLLGALAACAQLTCQMVAANMSIETDRIEAKVEGDLDLSGTLGLTSKPRSASARSACGSRSMPQMRSRSSSTR